MRKIFFTFGDGRDCFRQARHRVANEARATGVFDEVIEGDWSRVTAPEILQYPLRQERRGCGYWIWKPHLIGEYLNQLSEGDFLVWSDSGNTVYNNQRQWRLLFDELKRHDILVNRINCCAHRWTTRALMERFSLEIPKTVCNLCYQFESGFLAIRKTPFSCAFIDEWRNCMLEFPKGVRDATKKEMSQQAPSFIEHRHDQSVLTLLVYKYMAREETKDKIKGLNECHFGYWPFGDPAIYPTRWRSGDAAPKLSFQGHMNRAGRRILASLITWLEKHGCYNIRLRNCH